MYVTFLRLLMDVRLFVYVCTRSSIFGVRLTFILCTFTFFYYVDLWDVRLPFNVC
jgi:hypothetical protein